MVAIAGVAGAAGTAGVVAAALELELTWALVLVAVGVACRFAFPSGRTGIAGSSVLAVGSTGCAFMLARPKLKPPGALMGNPDMAMRQPRVRGQGRRGGG